MNRKTIAAALAFTGLAGLMSTAAMAAGDWGRGGDYRQECQRMWPGGQNGPRGMRGDDNGPRGMRGDNNGPRGQTCGDQDGPRGMRGDNNGPRGQMRNAAFSRADADNDGSVTFEEFQALMGGKLASADANGDGVVTPAELVDQLQKRREERAAEILKRFDTNNDGTVTVAEIEAAAKDRFAALDGNGDGALQKGEMRPAAGRLKPPVPAGNAPTSGGQPNP